MTALLTVENLVVDLETAAGAVHAVRGVSFQVAAGETLALVGESGSGKSVTMQALMGLLPPNGHVQQGSIVLAGQELTTMPAAARTAMRGQTVAMVFQAAAQALDPTMPVGKQVAEALRLHQRCPRKQAWRQAIATLTAVGIANAAVRAHDYPHQFSGGQRQRIAIACAIINQPRLLIADEPTTALDVTVQAQILRLLKQLQARHEMSTILVTHDLGVVAGSADRVVIMYAGRVVEYGRVDEIFYNPQHPYTWGLLQAQPTLESQQLWPIPGQPPDMRMPPPGDAFAARDPAAMQIDRQQAPPFFQVSPTHAAATWRLHPQAPKLPVPEAILQRWAQWREGRTQDD